MNKRTSEESYRDYSRLDKWLPEVIYKTGMSVEHFSYKAGISKQSLYFYMADKYRPSTQIMARICRTAGVPLEEGLQQYTPRRNGRPPRLSS